MKAYLIDCHTGCTCCSNENHYRGPYETKEIAQKRIDFFYHGAWAPLASQYAKRGCYYIEEVDYEVLQDGRVILDDRVYKDLEFIKLEEDGSGDDEGILRYN